MKVNLGLLDSSTCAETTKTLLDTFNDVKINGWGTLVINEGRPMVMVSVKWFEAGKWYTGTAAVDHPSKPQTIKEWADAHAGVAA